MVFSSIIWFIINIFDIFSNKNINIKLLKYIISKQKKIVRLF